jgi:hypothetical protein
LKRKQRGANRNEQGGRYTDAAPARPHRSAVGLGEQEGAVVLERQTALVVRVRPAVDSVHAVKPGLVDELRRRNDGRRLNE